MEHSAPRFHTTVTERAGFRTCRRRWYLENIDRYEVNAEVTWYLLYGDCMHDALDAYYRPKTSKSKKPPRDLVDAQDAFLERWARENKALAVEYGPLFSYGIEEEWLRYRQLGLDTLANYHTFDRAHPLFKTVIEVGVEERAFIDILDPAERTHIEGRPLLSGRIDLVVERLDGIWVIDHKNLASTTSDRILDVDDQLSGYCYIWYRLSGKPPRGAYYNVLIKDPPKPPRMLKNGTLSMDKSQRTTYAHYVEAIRNDLGIKRGFIQKDENGKVVADYNEMLNYLGANGWSKYFQRLGPVTRNIEELMSFERHLYHEYQDMAEALESEDWRYPNAGQYTCPGCKMMAICHAMQEQSDPQFVIESGYRQKDPRHSIPAEILDPEWKGV